MLPINCGNIMGSWQLLVILAGGRQKAEGRRLRVSIKTLVLGLKPSFKENVSRPKTSNTARLRENRWWSKELFVRVYFTRTKIAKKVAYT
ncbi:hypothetical protein [Nostoc mirabile]|uniref:hypothetical protein n=1 Tax=Nostoc mirabile TaxID=2907820 RepID=UPI001E50BB73|nr:hypothetical protein [Nostoc mirabile]